MHPTEIEKISHVSEIHTVNDWHIDYKCEFCGKSFSCAQNLKKHIYTVHEGHKDYKCESCGKLFSQAGNLRKHIKRKHTNLVLISEQLENIAESCSFECDNTWTKQNIKEECTTIENTSTKTNINKKSECINIKELVCSSDITNIKTEIKDEVMEQNFNANEESQSDLNFLCENELELDQIPIF